MESRVQVCGRIAVTLAGRRVEEALPGRQGRLLFVYLVAHRRRVLPRAELAAAVWPEDAPAAQDTALRALLSKLRRALGPEVLDGRGEVSLHLPEDVWVDLEAAGDALHRAESALARGEPGSAWGPARAAQHIAARGLLPGEDAPWVAERRRQLEDVHVRALETAASACLAIGGGELATAERTARTLVALAPYRESGHRRLIEALAARGNTAEALLAYHALRERLRDDLGVAPSPQTQELCRRLLAL